MTEAADREKTPILDGAITCVQPRQGYRFAVDALLLAHFTIENTERRSAFMELGAGSGVLSAILLRSGFPNGTAVEIQPLLHACCRDTAQANGLLDRLDCRLLDLRAIKGVLDAGSFPIVVANPPYHPAGAGRISPCLGEAIAKHEIRCSLADLLSAARFLLPVGGRLFVIYPAYRLSDLLAELPLHKLRADRLCCVHPRSDRDAESVLLRCSKVASRRLLILPPLVTHTSDGSPGPWYGALQRQVDRA